MDGRRTTLYQRVADSADALLRAYGGGGFGLVGVVRRPYDLAAAAVVGLILLMAIYAGGERRSYLAWLWAGVAAASVLLAVYERNRADRLGAEGADGFRDPARVEATAAAAQDIYEHAQRNITGEAPDDEQSLHPHLYAVSKLRGNQRWLRGDPHLVAALNTLRPFSLHDGHRVRLILEFLGEFYKRYDRLLNRPNDVHVRNEYTILYDVHVKTLNLVHELYFTKNLVLCANLEVVTRTVQARTQRMLRVLRHKYPAELRALHVVLGSAPRAYDGTWTSYDLGSGGRRTGLAGADGGGKADIRPFRILSSGEVLNAVISSRSQQQEDDERSSDAPVIMTILGADVPKDRATRKNAHAHDLESDNPLLALVLRDPVLLALPFVAPRTVEEENTGERLRSTWYAEVLQPLFASTIIASDFWSLLTTRFDATFVNIARSWSSYAVHDETRRVRMVVRALRALLDTPQNREHVTRLRRRANAILRAHLTEELHASAGDVVVMLLPSNSNGNRETRLSPSSSLPTRLPDLLLYRHSGADQKPRRDHQNKLVQQLRRFYASSVAMTTSRVIRRNRSVADAQRSSSRHYGWLANSVSQDGHFVEVKNARFARQRVADVIRQVRKAEHRVLEAAAALLSSRQSPPYIHPYSGVHALQQQPPSAPRSAPLPVDTGVEVPYYAGSFHAWITLPYNSRVPEQGAASSAERARLGRTHARLAHKLQWIEPLLLALASGDPRAVGRGKRFPRASMRSTFNMLSGYGTSDPAALLHLEMRDLPADRRTAVLESSVALYFDSERDARQALYDSVMSSTDETNDEALFEDEGMTYLDDRIFDLAAGHPNARRLSRDQLDFTTTRKTSEQVSLWANVAGSRVPYSACFDVTRWGDGQIEGIGSTLLWPEPRFFTKSNSVVSYPEMLREAGAGYMIPTFSDIRVEDCGKVFSRRLEKGWTPVWVKTKTKQPSAGGLDLALHFVHLPSLYELRKALRTTNASSTKQEIVMRADLPIAASDLLKARGFEFRALDNCPSDEIQEVLRLIALLAAASVHEEEVQEAGDGVDDNAVATKRVLREIERSRAGADKSWNDALVRVSTLGCFAPLSKQYSERVWRVCFGGSRGKKNSSTPPPPPPTSSAVAAYDYLLRLCSEAHALYSDHRVTQMLLGNSKRPPSPSNRNFQAWRQAFVLRLLQQQQRDDDNSDAFDERRAASQILRQNLSPSSSWKPDEHYLRRLASPRHQ